MTIARTDNEEAPSVAWRDRVQFAGEVGLVVVLFFVFAGGPPPATNEAHYLTRMKHFWNPDWCAGDLFLESPESQPVFQTVFGWPSLWWSLPAMAWVGRLVGWLWLSIAWVRLSRSLNPRCGWALFSAAIAIVLWDRFHMAGEWVVGGLEAKVPAYACTLFALTEIGRGRWRVCLLWLGLATAFHPLVGGWSWIAATVAWTMAFWRGQQSWNDVKSLLPWCLAAVALALLGIVPALRLDAGVDSESIRTARRIYVYWRLNHHLLLSHFPWYMVARHLLLIAAWLGLWLRLPRHPAHDRLQSFVLGCLFIALVGASIELITMRNWVIGASWMRYYWYRMTDSMLPVGMALAICRWLSTTWSDLRTQRVMALLLLCTATSITVTYLERQKDRRPAADQQGRRDPPGASDEYRDWVDVCAWSRSETDADALFLVPTYIQTFKWYAHRPEYVTWKDVPQGSRAINEWWKRRREIRQLGIYSRLPPDHAEMEQWSWKSAIDFVVMPRSIPSRWLFPVVFENKTYRVYRM